MRFRADFPKAIHAECAEVQRALAAAIDRGRRALEVREAQALPTGLKPRTQLSYADEWQQYEQFVRRVWSRELIPGMHEQWNAFVLWKYLVFRSQKCKPTSVFSCVSALAHFGTLHGFVLPTTKFDNDSLLYRQIKNMKREISLRYRAKHGIAGATYDVQQSTPLGNDSVSLICSAFSIDGECAFLVLCRRDRHHVAASVMQHTCGMRFGHFLSRAYRRSAFTRDAHGSFRLITDWHRYSGRRSYCLEFERSPRWSCLRYNVYRADGTRYATVTAASILQWHFSQLQRAGESLVFAPELGEAPSRMKRKRWLQDTLLQALPLSDGDARRHVDAVSPHAFRAGLAGDLLRAGVPPQSIAIWCRWWSMRAMRMYADRQELCAHRTSTGCRLIHR